MSHPSAATAAAARALRTALRGSVLVAGDSAYESARQVWNGAIDRRPAAVVRCADESDVVHAVRVARHHGLPLSVRGGGHDWAGRAVREGGLVLDLSEMRAVTVDPAGRTVQFQGGARAGDVLGATSPFGLAPVTGTVKAVGVTGLLLGGGYGLLAGRHGLAVDNLIEARVVLADGRAVTANAAENPDLYWALRGGGGNFGVVTSMRCRVHPIGTVLSGMILHPAERAVDVLRGHRDIIADAPDELTVLTGFFGGPDGRPLIFLLPVWCGELEQGRDLADRFDAIGKPLAGRVCPMDYANVLGMFDQAVVDGRPTEMGTRSVAEPTDEVIDILAGAAHEATSPLSGLYVHHFHGAASRVPETDTPFATRRDHLQIEIAACWEPADDGEKHRRWAREVSQRLSEHALPGGYPNLLGADELPRTVAHFGPNADRLLKTKDRYDPDHVFSAVASLDPTTTDPGD
ncbi:FAD-binding oxidoreductase [Streptomyces pseudovenezuelae]|nr:FAD-binding oxidoreductase [Streptomyces pseudovenezuelae]